MKYTASEIETMFSKALKTIEDGTPLRQILGTPGYPTRRKFYDWLEESEKMRERYARAKEIHLSALFDEMLEIAKAPLTETIEVMGTQGGSVTTKDNVQRSRLMIDTIKWRLAKEAPSKYGDKLDVTSGNKAIALPAIVGMVIKNETQSDEPADDDLF